MGQEFIIKSQDIEDKINQLLPSQGGFQAGVDFSASTTVIPIVDLTETAEGSTLRQDLQTSLSFNSVTTFDIADTTSTIIDTTGYFRIFGYCNISADSGAARQGQLAMTDGLSTKVLFRIDNNTASGQSGFQAVPYDFVVKLEAGDSVNITSNTTTVNFTGSTRQIADLQGNLVNP